MAHDQKRIGSLKMGIPFTQFLRPNGEKVYVSIDMPQEIEQMANYLVEKGYKFEMEQLKTGKIHMDCSKEGAEGPVALELCDDGPSLVKCVERLVKESHYIVFSKNNTVEVWEEDEDPEQFWRK